MSPASQMKVTRWIARRAPCATDALSTRRDVASGYGVLGASPHQVVRIHTQNSASPDRSTCHHKEHCSSHSHGRYERSQYQLRQ